MPNITLTKKGKMYACIVFFPSGTPKRWKYVRDLKSFASFLSKDHSSWKYFNVYEKGTKQFLKRFYSGNSIPKTLGLLALVLLTQKFTLSKTFNKTFDLSETQPLKNTTSNKTTFINGFNYYATIPTLKEGEESCL